jgi:putative RecB family exonuclease
MKLQELRQKSHISYSQIETYISCGLQYKFSRIDRLPPEFIPDNLVFGSTIHKLLAQFYEAKIIGDLMALSNIHDLFKKLWTEAAKGRDDIRYADGKDFETLLTLGSDLLKAWYSNQDDNNYQVLGIEEAFTFNLVDIPVPVIGAIDLVEEDEAGTIIIIDHKTAARSYSANDIDRNMQMTIYQMAAKSNGYADREILLRLDTFIKTKNPKFMSHYSVRTEVDEKRLIKKIRHVWDAISKEVFIPQDGSWRCNNCQYRQYCQEWFLDGGE